MFSLIWIALLIIILPISGFFFSKIYIFEGNSSRLRCVIMSRTHIAIGYVDGGFFAVLVAVFLVYAVLVTFACVAWIDGREPEPQKKQD